LAIETAVVCPSCGISVAPTLVSCPSCHTLIYADALKQLAAEAGNAGHPQIAVTAWRNALRLIPVGTTQHAAVTEKIRVLEQEIDRTREPFSIQAFLKKIGGIGPIGILLLILSKAKFLALGFTKAGTLITMLLSFGVYLTAWGWKFALGLILCTYVHEMGHVAALLRYGIPASAPMFIPGLGALVRMHQHPATTAQDARVGLAGPLWGLCATLVAAAAWYWTGSQTWAAIAQVDAWINLFNLMPVWQLDGGRGFRALTKQQRWIAVLALGALFAITSAQLLIVLLVLAIIRALSSDAPEKPDTPMLLLYIFLTAVLSFLSLIPVAVPRA
jgi:Zn-dependent protease